jgi:RNA polymerase sigma factor (sigma-70 family)
MSLNASWMNADTGNDVGDPFIPTRSTLLSRLKNFDDDRSWRRLFDTYWKLIYGVALKAGLRDVEAQEVVQETVIAVSRNIGSFQYDRAKCSFKTWLLTVTRSRISNQFRRRRKHAPLLDNSEDESGVDRLDQLPDERGNGLARLWDEEWERNLMDAAIERVKKQVPAEQFQMFDFYVLREWPAEKVARALGVSTALVYLAKHRVGKRVQLELKQIEHEQKCV